MKQFLSAETASADALGNEITLAAEVAYFSSAIHLGYTTEGIHKMNICHLVARFMVKSLAKTGHSVDQLLVTAPHISEHSIVSVNLEVDGETEEVIADPTWQQFLKKDKAKPNLPKVLFGTREQVIAQARHYGMDEEQLMHLYSDRSIRMRVDEGCLIPSDEEIESVESLLEP